MSKIVHITTEKAAQTYEYTSEIFGAMFEDVEELSKKKPDYVFTHAKVIYINRVLRKLIAILKEEPQGEFLQELDDQTLPQASDARMIMRSFKVALDAFCEKYESEDGWITPELIAELKAEGIDLEDDDDEDDNADEDEDWEEDDDEDWDDDQR